LNAAPSFSTGVEPLAHIRQNPRPLSALQILLHRLRITSRHSTSPECVGWREAFGLERHAVAKARHLMINENFRYSQSPDIPTTTRMSFSYIELSSRILGLNGHESYREPRLELLCWLPL
jgi:hypothetical protein